MVVVTNGGHSRSGGHSSPHAPFCTVLGDSWSWTAECSSRVRVTGRGSAEKCHSFGPMPWSWRQTVAILVPADIHCHVHRFAPLFGLIGAGGSSAHRACEQDSMLKLGRAVYLVQLCGCGDKPWPCLRMGLPFLMITCMRDHLSFSPSFPALQQVPASCLASPCH